jgi:hypothetical protein
MHMADVAHDDPGLSGEGGAGEALQEVCGCEAAMDVGHSGLDVAHELELGCHSC